MYHEEYELVGLKEPNWFGGQRVENLLKLLAASLLVLTADLTDIRLSPTQARP